MNLKDYLETTIDLHKKLNRGDDNINDLYDDFFKNSKNIKDQTNKIFTHPDGEVSLHDGFLTVASERKEGAAFNILLKGEGFLYGKDKELGRVNVAISLRSSVSFRKINNREIYALGFDGDQMGVVFHENGFLRSVEGPVSDVKVVVGQDVLKLVRPTVHRAPATILITTDQGQTALPAIWSTQRKVYILENEKEIGFEKYDLRARHGHVKKVEVFVNEEPSIRSNVKLNDDDYFHTNASIKNHFDPKRKIAPASKKPSF